jgi:signal transduction histidine kinase
MARVLVVDDEKPVRDLVSSLVADMGEEVEVAADGAEAWEMLQHTPYDLVITDLKMPRMDGIELLKQIRKTPGETMVIILTGYASVQTAIESLRLGAYDYIEKPFSLIALEYTIKRALDRIKLVGELKTSIKRLQEFDRKLQSKHEELKTTQERLIQTEKLTLFSKMASFVVHNLKASISTLSLMLQNSAKYMGNHIFLEESFKDIGHEVKRIESLISLLQHVPKEIDLPYKLIDINSLIEQSISILPFDNLSHIDLIKDFRDIPLVNGHEQLLKATFCNILKNAVEAMPNGGKLWISTNTFGARHKGSFIQIIIRDTGIGMLPCFIEYKLFKPFHTTKPTGLGLGLYHSREIIERHGGIIRVRSQLNQGTTFTILLPDSSASKNIPQCYIFN